LLRLCFDIRPEIFRLLWILVELVLINDNHSSVLSVIILITDIEIIGLCFYFSCLLNIDNSTDSIDLLI